MVDGRWSDWKIPSSERKVREQGFPQVEHLFKTATFLFGGSPRIKKRQERGARRAGWVDLRRSYQIVECDYLLATVAITF